MIAVVEFKEKDIDIVYNIQQAAYKPLYDKYQDDDTNLYMEKKEITFQKYMREGTQGYIFYKDDIPVGAVRVLIDVQNKTARVSALGVLPEYQGQGIAREAMLEIEKIHSEIKKWNLDTILREEGNCHLYEKIGYIRTGKTEEINEKMTLIYYEKVKN
jgi:ribosomal protein S18 acetylase RimI-like enzyme